MSRIHYIYIMKPFPILLAVTIFSFSCSGQNKSEAADASLNSKTQPAASGQVVSEFGRHIRSIFQDRHNDIWLGTDGDGVYRYNGKSIILYTVKDGLSHNQIRTIQEDKAGNIWFATGDGVSRFDGRTFSSYENSPRKSSLALLSNDLNSQLIVNTSAVWDISPDDLWFDAPMGVYRYDGSALNYLRFPQSPEEVAHDAKFPDNLNPYAVYCFLKDSKGNLWFGTESKGVGRYDGKSFRWFNEGGLNGAAVRAIFEDKEGTLWFSNNGLGLFRYDGQHMTNFTEEKGLSNPAYVRAIKENVGSLSKSTSKENTLASVMDITGDNDGRLWVATYDSGVWRYDGRELSNYSMNDGLPTNAIMTVYKDKKGDIWAGTDGGGAYKFNGRGFTKFTGQ